MTKTEKPEPRARILEIADQLFYAEGVRATGTEKIMASADVAKATFYHHFKSKDALVLAYLDNRDDAFWTFLLTPKEPADIRAALAKIDRYANRPEVMGCPFLRIASEYPDPAHPFHQRVITHKDKLLRYLRSLMPPDMPNPEKSARMLLAIIDGALSMRLIYGTAHHAPLLPAAEAVLHSSRT